MTNMNEAAKRAAELANDCRPNGFSHEPYTANDFEEGSEIGYDAEAFRKYIQHVSDVAERVSKRYDMGSGHYDELRALILPKPVDPLVEACFALGRGAIPIADLRTELAKRGLTLALIGEQP